MTSNAEKVQVYHTELQVSKKASCRRWLMSWALKEECTLQMWDPSEEYIKRNGISKNPGDEITESVGDSLNFSIGGMRRVIGNNVTNERFAIVKGFIGKLMRELLNWGEVKSYSILKCFILYWKCVSTQHPWRLQDNRLCIAHKYYFIILSTWKVVGAGENTCLKWPFLNFLASMPGQCLCLRQESLWLQMQLLMEGTHGYSFSSHIVVYKFPSFYPSSRWFQHHLPVNHRGSVHRHVTCLTVLLVGRAGNLTKCTAILKFTMYFVFFFPSYILTKWSHNEFFFPAYILTKGSHNELGPANHNQSWYHDMKTLGSNELHFGPNTLSYIHIKGY